VRGARVEYLPEARQELEDALEWYLERSLQTAEVFVREIDRALALIASAPTIWPHFESGTRRYVLSRFPYNIIYRTTEPGIEVIAFVHHKRRPRYWRRRVGG
jgi:toxin ParE1/3/4